MADVVGSEWNSHTFNRPPLAYVADFAADQGGPISHAQLLELGVSPDQIKYWSASSRLHCLFRSVYAVGHTALTRKGWLLAAVLACGENAVVSHLTAAWCWRYVKRRPMEVDITVPGRTRTGQDGINLHSVRRLDPRDVTVVKGVPITTPERTLLDIAEILPLHQLRLAIDEADRGNHFHPEKLQQVLQRNPGRRGQKPLRTLLSDLEAEPLLRSEIEKLFRELCHEYDLPIPTTNTEVNGHEVDAYWPEHRLIAEVDSRKYHLNGRAFEDDRRRDADHLAAGYRVMRVTYRQLRWDRRGVAERLRKALLSG
jgi:transcriptional regulator with AbiEi antitoxin domain of type IV toxin-antitoxin system